VRGDWPDWWSDGFSGDARATMLMREAQRGLSYLTRLLERYPDLPRPDLDPVRDDLVLYSEHTFSHACAMSDPWDPMVAGISSRKRAYAATAHDAVAGLTSDALSALGAAGLTAGLPTRYRAVNPLAHGVSGTAPLFVGHYEFHELGLGRGARVVDVASGETLPCQRVPVPMGDAFHVHVALAPGEERALELRACDGDGDGEAADPRGKAAEEPGAHASPETEPTDAGASLETPFVRITWEPGEGIVSWVDRRSDTELLRPDRRHGAFTPVYEVTPVPGPDEICAVRGRMVLNRKGEDARRTAGCLVGSKGIRRGDVFVSTILDYGVPGISTFLLELRAHVFEPRVDVAVRFHKDSVWEPENVYLSLPFTAGDSSVLWLDKTGALVRPRVDQLPGTLTDFASIQEGLAVVGDDLGLSLATPDSPLVQLGPLEHGERLLMGDPELADDPCHLYAWLMTNYWETNFAASLGGFYEFRYSVKWDEGLRDPQAAVRACRDMNHGITCFRAS